MSRFPHARFLVSAAAPAQFPADDGAEVAFAGRSNAGKSSAINAIAHRHGLARTSKAPGRTRLLNFFELMPQRRIVDLPGYGYASAPESEASPCPTDLTRSWSSMRSRTSATGGSVMVMGDIRVRASRAKGYISAQLSRDAKALRRGARSRSHISRSRPRTKFLAGAFIQQPPESESTEWEE